MRTARVLLFVIAGAEWFVAVAYLAAPAHTGGTFGRAVPYAIGGAVSFLLARRVARGGPVLRRWIIAVKVLAIMGALVRFGRGDTRALLGLVLPTLVVVLVCRRSAREYFFDQA